jgi:hypothetical protein
MRIGRPANLGLLAGVADELEDRFEVGVGPQVELPDEASFVMAEPGQSEPPPNPGHQSSVPNHESIRRCSGAPP